MGFGVMNDILMIMYGMSCFFALLGVALIGWFAKKLPREFVKLGKIANCMGCILKISLKLVFLLSWVTLIMVLV